jgi:hypothetical protein
MEIRFAPKQSIRVVVFNAWFDLVAGQGCPWNRKIVDLMLARAARMKRKVRLAKTFRWSTETEVELVVILSSGVGLGLVASAKEPDGRQGRAETLAVSPAARSRDSSASRLAGMDRGCTDRRPGCLDQ